MTQRYVLPHIERMTGYQPGEQPRVDEIIKLNTNENPYPPSPRVAEAIIGALGTRLRKYPDPMGSAFREAAARLHGVQPSMILAGNGSDDLLTILIRTFAGPGDIVVSPTPSYILYRTLAEIQNARSEEVPFGTDWSLDPNSFAVPGAKIEFLANPNSPSGTALDSDAVGTLARHLSCPLVLDEAYADFASFHGLGLIRDHPNIIVTRSFSKGYSLAGLRLGYLVARPEIVEELIKVKDSYNCDTLSQLGGIAALEDQDYHAETIRRVLATRARLTTAVRELGFHVPESQANFVWCTGNPRAVAIYEALKERKILVRLMRYPGHEPGLRITVGTDEEIDRLLAELRTLV
jgi:histidinol-phosphate aminotransferase